MKRLMLAGLILLVGCSSEEVAEPKKEPKIVEEKKEEKTETVEPEKTITEKPTPPPVEETHLNFTSQTFLDALYKQYKEIDASYEMIGELTEQGAALSPNDISILQGFSDENGNINTIQVVMYLSEANDIQLLDFMLAQGVIISMTNPGLSAEERGKIVMEELPVENMKNGMQTAISGKVAYRLAYFPETDMIIFDARHVDYKGE